MTSRARPPLGDRVAAAAQATLDRQHHTSMVDVLLDMRWLDVATFERWERGQLSCLVAGIQTKPARIVEALRVFHDWTIARGLHALDIPYVARTPARPVLRFSPDGDETIERVRTRWLAGGLSPAQRERIEAKLRQPPELVVIQPLDHDWRCHRCGGSDGLLMMEPGGPACLPCAGLGDLVYLPAGDPPLSRRAKAASPVHVVVVRFSRARKRYERQGLLVTPDALRRAEEASR